MVNAPGSETLPFRIEGNGSLVTVAEIDYEKNTSYPIEVRGWTDEGETVFHGFTISVLDKDESFSYPNNSPYGLEFVGSKSFFENTEVGTVLGKFSAFDKDVNSKLNYSLHDSSGLSSNFWFHLDSNGTLSTANLFDYESNKNYTLKVRVTDEFESFMESDFIFQILNADEIEPIVQMPNELKFESTKLEIFEDAKIGTLVGTIFRVSGDLNLSTIFSLERNQDISLPFNIESNGSIVLKDNLDYEIHSNYFINVRGTEGNRSAVQNFEIKIMDVLEKNSNSAPFDIVVTPDKLKIRESGRWNFYLS